MSSQSRRAVWPRSVRAAIDLQIRLRGKVRAVGGPRRISLVAGADVAYDSARNLLFAAVLVHSYPELVLREVRSVRMAARFPYVPGLLSFREAPALIRAFRRLRLRPDLLICDGQGIAHPRGIGLASHLGLLLGVPTIGCAKSRLVGEHGVIGPNKGDRKPLIYRGLIVGAVVRSRTGVRPLYVSPGHAIDVARSVTFVLDCCRGYRLPEPVRQADILVARLKRLADDSAVMAPLLAPHGRHRNASRVRIPRGTRHERIARSAT